MLPIYKYFVVACLQRYENFCSTLPNELTCPSHPGLGLADFSVDKIQNASRLRAFVCMYILE